MTLVVRSTAIARNESIQQTEVASQLDIFGFSPNAVMKIRPSKPVASEPAAKKTIGHEFALLWRGYCDALDAYHHALEELSAIEQEVMPAGEYLRAIRVQSKYTMRTLKETVAKDMQKRLVCHAESLFAPRGTRLSIDTDKLRNGVSQNAGDFASFDPALVWQYLESHYCGHAGQEMAWMQAAARFIKTFGLDNGKAIVRKSGYVLLDRHVGMDDFDKRFSKINRLGYRGVESVSECYQSLIAFAEWAEDANLVRDLRLGAKDWDRTTDIVSRKQYLYGEKAEIVLVTFVGRFEFRLKEKLAQQLQIFLGTYLRK